MNEPLAAHWSAIIIASAFAAYFLGILIRKTVLPGKDSPPLSRQLLLGIPISLVVVPSLLSVLSMAIRQSDVASFLVALGVIIEHGMLLNETATSRLQRLQKTWPTLSEPPRQNVQG